MSLGLAAVLYLAGSNIGSGWIVLLAAALVAAPPLDLIAAWTAHRRTTVRALLTGPFRVGTTGLRVDVDRPAGLTALRVSAGEATDLATTTRGVTRRSSATVAGPILLRRGVHSAIPIATETIGPLGLGLVRSDVLVPTEQVVHPPIVPCPARLRRVIGGVDDEQARRRARQDDEIQGVRPFVQGDPQRLVNWRATARHGQVMVREHTRRGGGGTIDLVVDGGSWDPEALDLACTIIASLGHQATTDGHTVNLHIDGARVVWSDSTPAFLSTLPPASGVDNRPLLATSGAPTSPALRLSADEGSVLAAHPGSDTTLLSDAHEVTSWLQT